MGKTRRAFDEQDVEGHVSRPGRSGETSGPRAGRRSRDGDDADDPIGRRGRLRAHGPMGLDDDVEGQPELDR